MTNAIPTDYENIRTQEEFREHLDNETALLRRIGLSDHDIGLFMAGARWCARVYKDSIQEQRRVA